MSYKSWGEVFNSYLRKGYDHGCAAYAADEWEKRQKSRQPVQPKEPLP